MNLSDYSRKLYRLTAKMNLYICMAEKNNKPDKIRLKKNIEEVKKAVEDFEKRVDDG